MTCPPRARAIIQAVAATVETTADEVLSDSRYQRDTFARALAMLAVQRFYVPRPTTCEIGRMFGRDHSTVISAIRRAQREANDPVNAGIYDAAMTAAFEAWTSATAWVAPAKLETPVPLPQVERTRGRLTVALVAPALERGASLAEAAKEIGCSTSALYKLQQREPELRELYAAAVKRGKATHAEHRRKFGSIWTRGNPASDADEMNEVGKAAE